MKQYSVYAKQRGKVADIINTRPRPLLFYSAIGSKFRPLESVLIEYFIFIEKPFASILYVAIKFLFFPHAQNPVTKKKKKH